MSRIIPGTLDLTKPVDPQFNVIVNAIPDVDDFISRKEAGQYKTRTKAVYTRNQDPLYESCNTLGDEMLTILPSEVCLMWKSKRYKRPTANPNIPVFSSLNGIRFNCDSNKECDFEDVRDALCFAGISANGSKYNSKDHWMRQGFSLAVGGKRTLINISNKDIYPGDLLMWDLPKNKDNSDFNKHYDRRTPNHKVQVPLIPFRDHSIEDAVVEIVKEKNLEGDAALKEAIHVHRDMMSRIVARALSAAKPGAAYDIFIGHYGY